MASYGILGYSRASSMAWWAGAPSLTLPQVQNHPCLDITSKSLAIAEPLRQLLGCEVYAYPTDGSRNKLTLKFWASWYD